MKNLYFLTLLLCFGAFAQNVTITKIIETGCPSATGFLKSVELYVDGTVDFGTDVTLNYMQNGDPWAANQIDISALGEVSDSFVYIVRDLAVMQSEFPSTTFDASNTVVVGTSTNGDDGYQVVLNGNVVSQFGRTETDADDDTESDWNHNDAVATRLDGIPDLGTWDPSHWSITAENDLDDHTACQGVGASQNLEAYFATLGSTFPLGSGSGWTPSNEDCTTILNDGVTECSSLSAGDSDDTYSVTLDFSGGNNGNNFVVNSTAGTIGGDDPSSVESGTITVTDVPEGTSITVTLSDVADGGNCDLSTDVESPACVPLVLNEALFDPPSDDDQTAEVEGDANNDGTRDALDDEFIEFFNNSNSPLDISGFAIYDSNAFSSGTPRHVVPANTVIPANSAYVVFGGGTPTGSFGTAIVETASSGELNLTNSGDVITVENASGNIAIVFDSSGFSLDFGDNQSITRSPDVTGDYVLHTTANPDLVYSPGLEVTGETLSIESEILSSSLVLYPNPVSNGQLFIQSETQINSVQVFNLLGAKVFEQTSVVDGQAINLNTLNTGAYIVRLSANGNTINKKIIIK
jgi:hypothetical protein